jgi:putative transcriptional regulator
LTGPVAYASGVTDLAPGLLIAVPQMEDANFSRSVVLLIEHSEQGAMGIVFNRPADIPLSDIGKEQGITVHPEAGNAYIGGPVSPERGFILHRCPEVPESVQVHEGIWLSVSTDSLKPLLEGDPNVYRLCLGYAGWGPGQLEREVVVGGWLTGKASAQRVFETPTEKVWDAAIRDLGFDPAFLVQAGGPQ